MEQPKKPLQSKDLGVQHIDLLVTLLTFTSLQETWTSGATLDITHPTLHKRKVTDRRGTTVDKVDTASLFQGKQGDYMS